MAAQTVRVHVQRGSRRPDVDLYVVAASRIMDSYRTRLARRSQPQESARLGRRVADIERELASDAGTRLIQELDLRDASYRA
jgi:predicted NAD-dependent protein-ADP-ribosyltransferase YbiA (DUF1768 family)